MLENCVLVLGSGKSMLNLTEKERQWLNTCEVKIGINKYAAFYEIAGIEPSHVYFHDDYDESSIRMLNYIFKLFKKNKLKKKTFILSDNYKGFVFSNYIEYFILKHINYFKISFIFFTTKLGRFVLKKISVKRFNDFIFFLNKIVKVNPVDRYNFLIKKSKVQYVTIQDSTLKGNKWANSLNEQLYHFKGSFSTVLNYISICYPKRTVLLAGVDFNSADYFFEKELSSLGFNTKDWTYDLKKQHNKHYSIIETHGVKIDNELPFMLNKLKESNDKIFSLNLLSYLVEQNYVEYIRLDDFLKLL